MINKLSHGLSILNCLTIASSFNVLRIRLGSELKTRKPIVHWNIREKDELRVYQSMGQWFGHPTTRSFAKNNYLKRSLMRQKKNRSCCEHTHSSCTRFRRVQSTRILMNYYCFFAISFCSIYSFSFSIPLTLVFFSLLGNPDKHKNAIKETPGVWQRPHTSCSVVKGGFFLLVPTTSSLPPFITSSFSFVFPSSCLNSVHRSVGLVKWPQTQETD